jgi:hypothetical protein
LTLTKLMEISKENIAIAKQITPLINQIPSSLLYRLIELCDEIVFSNDVSINQSFQSNFEFLDTIRSFLFVYRCKVPNQPLAIMGEEQVDVLLSKIDFLLEELNDVTYRKRISRRKVTDFKTDEEEPEPTTLIYKGGGYLRRAQQQRTQTWTTLG